MSGRTDRDLCGGNLIMGGKQTIDSSRNMTGKNGDFKSLDTNQLVVNKNATFGQNISIVGTITADTITAQHIARASASPAATPAQQRQDNAYDIRVKQAYNQYKVTPDEHVNNDDETTHPEYFAQFSKGLQHDEHGNPIQASYESLLTAVSTGSTLDYDAIITGHTDARLKNPQAAVAYDLEGADTHVLSIPSAPAFSSAWRAGEAVENYWMALLRDVSFSDYGTGANTDVAGLSTAACADLNNMSDFRGPKESGDVTPATLFRMNPAGCIGGPFISQFLYLDCPYGAVSIDQKMTTPIAGSSNDFLKTLSTWLDAQNGKNPSATLTMDGTKRYIRNGRDIGQWVHIDVLNQLSLHAMLILFSIGCPVNAGNPYNSSANQCGFSTFGGPHLISLLGEVAARALRAVWFQKWNVHRALRPEAYGGCVDRTKAGVYEYPVHADVLTSDALVKIHEQNATWFLPQAFPEGSPLHPAYGSGHATVAGACITILKAWFDGSFVISSPVQPDADGLVLEPYIGSDLTVEGELNKLASNIAQGRVIAGVHWRSDSDESITLGEKVAIQLLHDQRALFNENFAGFTFKKFDGTTVTV
jgi:membrane-associated phospholipid phosphatase